MFCVWSPLPVEADVAARVIYYYRFITYCLSNMYIYIYIYVHVCIYIYI